MNRTPGSKGEDKAGSIPKTPVVLAWGQGYTLSQIAARTGLPIKSVNQQLKKTLKDIVKNGAKSHGKEYEF
jgi:DNA-directed RNA polymerase specialized sigma24 family protein